MYHAYLEDIIVSLTKKATNHYFSYFLGAIPFILMSKAKNPVVIPNANYTCPFDREKLIFLPYSRTHLFFQNLY
jgi:hypothetical protein